MDDHKNAFESFAEEVSDLPEVEKVVLYGSVARGEHGVNSDVDALVVVNDLSSRDEIEDIAFKTASEYGVSITLVVVEERDKNSFLETVEREGIEYVRG